jgi:CRISPR type III-A-associated protein Csm2
MSEMEEQDNPQAPIEPQPQAEATPPPEAAAPPEVAPPSEAAPPAEAAPAPETKPPAEAKPAAEAKPPAEARPRTEGKPESRPPESREARPPRPERRSGPPPRGGAREGAPREGAPREGQAREHRGPERGPERGPDRGPRPDRGGPRPDFAAEIDIDKLIGDSLYLDNQAHAVVARMRDMDSGTRSQLRRLYSAIRRGCRAPEIERQHHFVMLRARLAYTIARHQLRSLDVLEKLLLQVTRRNDARCYERFRDLFEAIVAYNE